MHATTPGVKSTLCSVESNNFHFKESKTKLFWRFYVLFQNMRWLFLLSQVLGIALFVRTAVHYQQKLIFSFKTKTKTKSPSKQVPRLQGKQPIFLQEAPDISLNSRWSFLADLSPISPPEVAALPPSPWVLTSCPSPLQGQLPTELNQCADWKQHFFCRAHF